MRNATGHAPRGKWAAVKKMVNRNTYISSIKRVSGKFLEVSRCSRAKQRQRNVQKSVLYVQSCILLDLFFYQSRCLHLFFIITRFYVLFE